MKSSNGPSKKTSKSRREFLTSAMALSSIPLFPYSLHMGKESILGLPTKESIFTTDGNKSIIGAYGNWATSLVSDPPELSFRHTKWTNLDQWRQRALEKTKELVSVPIVKKGSLGITLKASYEYDGLLVEELQWQLPYGNPTRAILLKPKDASGSLPAVLGLHDHGGQKYFGKRKITKTSDELHPMIVDHQKDSYSGLAWANELAKRGYVVMVHDTFTFGSRRVKYGDVDGITWGHCMVGDKTDQNPEDPQNIKIYNEWAAEHEHIMSKSLFCGGTTWPGVTLLEDQIALDILCDRSDVDEEKVGCCGLSGGGLRTDYLGGLDHRIQCAISVGFMSTWNDFLLNKSFTHTWMTYVPLLPKFLDFPEVLGLRVPLPTMVMSNNEDQLYALPEMKKADTILREVYKKAGASDRYSGKFYPGGHKFDTAMQDDAFKWFDKWLK
ncbi:dienelactone hydrolase family protein [Ulvibacterium marinum]|uniref:hypothetical protein n=1 Tax=Ulvibacterium marinum TaxID=2419782 RepID=UPI001B881D69|nr:hypothetical protein [Ulvibacterium marinum]